jgi:hypothetical protein
MAIASHQFTSTGLRSGVFDNRLTRSWAVSSFQRDPEARQQLLTSVRRSRPYVRLTVIDIFDQRTRQFTTPTVVASIRRRIRQQRRALVTKPLTIRHELLLARQRVNWSAMPNSRAHAGLSRRGSYPI